MNAYKQSIRAIYPQDGGRIALRTDENWNTDVEAISHNGCTTTFQIETERPYFYFKPVLLRDGATMWSRGENCLAIATSRKSSLSEFILTTGWSNIRSRATKTTAGSLSKASSR